MFPVSLDCSFLIVPSILSNVSLHVPFFIDFITHAETAENACFTKTIREEREFGYAHGVFNFTFNKVSGSL